MDFKVVFCDTFLKDLEHIVKSIALQNTAAARQLGERIIQASERLSFLPERHPLVKQRPGVRRLIVRKYFKIFYRVRQEGKVVEILRCWDGRQRSDPSFGATDVL
jgi:addiction module RelE/StbE family toxin